MDKIEALRNTQEMFDQVVSNPNTLQPWSGELIQTLSLYVLGFIVIAFLLCSILLWRSKTDALEILKVFGILSILGLSTLLLLTGFSNEQLTPIVGLFGAIAGYLLGKEKKQEEKSTPEEENT